MFGAWDIYTAPEPGRLTETPFNGFLTEEEMVTLKNAPGINAGVIGFRADRFLEITEEWGKLNAREPLRHWHSRDQHSCGTSTLSLLPIFYRVNNSLAAS